MREPCSCSHASLASSSRSNSTNEKDFLISQRCRQAGWRDPECWVAVGACSACAPALGCRRLRHAARWLQHAAQHGILQLSTAQHSAASPSSIAAHHQAAKLLKGALDVAGADGAGVEASHKQGTVGLRAAAPGLNVRGRGKVG